LIASGLEYLVIIVAGTVFALGYVLFCMEVAPALAVAIRMAVRVVRVLFLAVGWVVVVLRLLL
jgi:hypothetical protein